MFYRIATLSTAFALALLVASPAHAQSPQTPPCDVNAPFPALTFAASLTTGDHGQLWSIEFDQGFVAALKVSAFYPRPTELKGSIVLETCDVQRIAAVAQTAGFLTLPERLTPPRNVPLHAAYMTVRIATKDGTHSVSVYDPAHVEDQLQVERFMSVWNAIFRLSPLKPPGQK
jgi:hypothetical protein